MAYTDSEDEDEMMMAMMMTQQEQEQRRRGPWVRQGVLHLEDLGEFNALWAQEGRLSHVVRDI